MVKEHCLECKETAGDVEKWWCSVGKKDEAKNFFDWGHHHCVEMNILETELLSF